MEVQVGIATKVTDYSHIFASLEDWYRTRGINSVINALNRKGTPDLAAPFDLAQSYQRDYIGASLLSDAITPFVIDGYRTMISGNVHERLKEALQAKGLPLPVKIFKFDALGPSIRRVTGYDEYGDKFVVEIILDRESIEISYSAKGIAISFFEVKGPNTKRRYYEHRWGHRATIDFFDYVIKRIRPIVEGSGLRLGQGYVVYSVEGTYAPAARFYELVYYVNAGLVKKVVVFEVTRQGTYRVFVGPNKNNAELIVKEWDYYRSLGAIIDAIEEI